MTSRHYTYPGAKIIEQQPRLRQRAGLRVAGKVPVRKGAVLRNPKGDTVGTVTSGSFAPTVGEPIAMAYIDNEYAEKGTTLFTTIRNKQVELTVTGLPFIPHRYRR